uniref:Uncharacterized protein n=1 Tax=Sphaerodactylus townsendi TaxID=933632 RepID=A0ACB8FYD5_9SAUR
MAGGHTSPKQREICHRHLSSTINSGIQTRPCFLYSFPNVCHFFSPLQRQSLENQKALGHAPGIEKMPPRRQAASVSARRRRRETDCGFLAKIFVQLREAALGFGLLGNI